jgi:predicted Rossmann fold flavoprotein
MDKLWDVVVIGGGPAGMMAAGRAAECGRLVVLLEKNPSRGKKLLISGGGRCNFTNNKPDVRVMLAQYKVAGKFLFSAFSQWGVSDTIDFFRERGMAVKEEAEGRMFPVSDQSQSVFDVLDRYVKDGHVEIRENAEVIGLAPDAETGHIIVCLKDGPAMTAQSCILATGGMSHPETGSTGEGFVWLRKLGHTINDTDASLVPIALRDPWVKKLSGVTLTDIKLTVFQGEEKKFSRLGKLLFTHVGVSGPTVLNMSKDIGGFLKEGEVWILLDLFPHLDHGALKGELQTRLTEESNKLLRNTLARMVPATLASILLELAGIDADTVNRTVSGEMRAKIISLMKAVPLRVKGLLGEDKAIVTSGGVALEEVNFKTMESRIVPHLFLVGDVLDINRPSGGYSLQLCWTTGFVAGSHS